MSQNVQFAPTEEQEIQLLKRAGFKVNSDSVLRVAFYKEPRLNRQIQRRERQEKAGRKSDGTQVFMLKDSYSDLSEAEKTDYEDNPIFDIVPIPYIIGKNGKIKGNWTNGLQPYEVNYLAAKYNLPIVEIPKGQFDPMPVIKIDQLKVWDYRNYADQAEVLILLESPKVVVKKEDLSREKPILLYILQEERANKVGEIEKHANKLATIIDANQKLSTQEKAMIVELLRYNGIVLTGSNNEKDLAGHFLSVIEKTDHVNELCTLLNLYGKDNAEAKNLLWYRLWYNRSKINLDVFFDEDTNLWKGRVTDREADTLGAEESEAFNAYVEKHKKGFKVWVDRAKELYKEERKDDHQLLAMDSYNVKTKEAFLSALSNEETETEIVPPIVVDPTSGVTNDKGVIDDFDPSKATEIELRDWVHNKCTEEQINAYSKLRSNTQKVEFVHKMKNTGK